MIYLPIMSVEELPCPTPADCIGKPHPMAAIGLYLFNTGQYWKAHEALEEAWRAEKGQIRHLYRGILQVGVTYLHIQQGNYAGALKVSHRCGKWLAPFPNQCRGIQVGKLRSDLENVMAEVQRLGPANLAQLDPAMLKPIEWEIPEHRHPHVSPPPSAK